MRLLLIIIIMSKEIVLLPYIRAIETCAIQWDPPQKQSFDPFFSDIMLRWRWIIPVAAPPFVQIRFSSSNNIPGSSSETSAKDATARFWSHSVPAVPLSQLKAEYGAARNSDKRSRFRVREAVRDDGVISNFYPLYYPQDRATALEKAPLYVYEMQALRTVKAPSTGVKPRKGGKRASSEDSDQSDANSVRSIHPSTVWEAVRRFFQQIYMNFPPIVRLDHKIYTTQPLSPKALHVPPAYHDLGWDSCNIRLVGKYSYAMLPSDELQRVVNKIVPWCIRRTPAGRHAVVREAKGKFVSTEMGLVANGVRVYQGVTVHALFIDTSKTASVSPGGQGMEEEDQRVLSKDLLEAEVGGKNQLRFTVHAFVRDFEYKGKKVESYKIEDASGVYLASYWEPPQSKSLVEGCSYTASGWKLKVYPERNNMRLFEFQKNTIFEPMESKNGGGEEESVGKATIDTNAFRGCLSLKIDAKGTVASELSLWEEVRQQFGPGPYDIAAQERIRRAVEGTPIVTSVTMLQGIARTICFDISEESEEGRFARQFLPHEVRKVLPKMDALQPYALLQDGTLWPLQALHCCFDPQMKSWQDVTISALSLLPPKRVALLAKFQKVLQAGLQLWGLELSEQPWRTKALSLLPPPQKDTKGRDYLFQKNLTHPFAQPHPSTVVVVGILGEDQAYNGPVRETADRVGRYFKSQSVSCVKREAEAVQYITDQLVDTSGGAHGVLRDKNCVAIIITMFRDSRAVRWVVAECLSRGILPLTLNAPKSSKFQGLLCGNARRQILTSFESDPLFGIKVYKEIPAIAGKNILCVGVDTCHTTSHSAGSAVGILCTPERNHLIPFFWHHEARGSEVGHVSDAFQRVLSTAKGLYERLDEVVVFQDGDVFSTMEDLKEEIRVIAPSCGFCFMCLHKRGNIRFIHGKEGGQSRPEDLNNISKGAIIQDLTPLPLDGGDDTVESFYLQSHEGNMSTSRIVHFTVHHRSPTLPIPIVQQLSNCMSNVLAPQSTKLPMPTRCAHRLADKAERLLDAVPQLQCEMIPAPLSERLWFF
eukprot:gene4030-2884_t